MFFKAINMYGKPVYQAWGEVLKINRKNVRKESKNKRNISEVIEERKPKTLEHNHKIIKI